MYADRIEFVFIGGLMTGVSLDDVMMDLSVCRNVKLANVFYRLQLIEAYGTGMRKIMGAYHGTYWHTYSRNCELKLLYYL